MSEPTPIRGPSRVDRFREIGSDILIVAALIYGLPLLVGLAVLLVRLLTA